METITCDKCNVTLPKYTDEKKRKFIFFKSYDKVKESFYEWEGLVLNKKDGGSTLIHLCKRCQTQLDEFLFSNKWKRKLSK